MQINLEKNVTIEFKPEQIGFILAVLRKQSYEQVVDLITSIQSQIIDQAKPEVKMNGLKETFIQDTTLT